MKQDRVISEVLGEEIALSPSDLLNQQFKRAGFGGYQRRQVDDFIERVADVLEGLINQVRQLKEKNEEQRRAIAEYEEIEAALRNTLMTSQHHGNQILDAARREAHVIIEEAKLKRAQAQSDATKLPTHLARDIQLLEQQRSRLRVELLAILETHRKLIDSLVPADVATTPMGFFEVGDPLGFPNDAPLAYAEEPIKPALESKSRDRAEEMEPDSAGEDQSMETPMPDLAGDGLEAAERDENHER
ncbi:MAG: DivIVA domain-containing protein [Candidatus Hydrogenedentes bacterium]|nr:DivIVA domain-containing protein [Candidatus Hydrogenedentota bacterium]